METGIFGYWIWFFCLIYSVEWCEFWDPSHLFSIRKCWVKIYTSENQNTEFFKCDLFWRIAIYHNSELCLVHLNTDKSHTFIKYLVIFCVSLSERIERIERGAMIEKYFYEEFGMESLKFKGTNEEFKDENYVYL